MSNFEDFMYEEQTFEAPKPGKYRCVILSAEESVSKSSGKPMIKLTVRPSGMNNKINHYIVKNDNFNRNMSRFFDSFSDIKRGDFNFLTWTGAMGGADFGL